MFFPGSSNPTHDCCSSYLLRWLPSSGNWVTIHLSRHARVPLRDSFPYINSVDIVTPSPQYRLWAKALVHTLGISFKTHSLSSGCLKYCLHRRSRQPRKQRNSPLFWSTPHSSPYPFSPLPHRLLLQPRGPKSTGPVTRSPSAFRTKDSGRIKTPIAVTKWFPVSSQHRNYSLGVCSEPGKASAEPWGSTLFTFRHGGCIRFPRPGTTGSQRERQPSIVSQGLRIRL